MKLFWRKQQHPEPVIPPELQPYYGSGYRATGWRRYVLPALIVLGMLIVGAVIWAIINMATGDDAKKRDQSLQSPQSNPVLQTDDQKPAKTDLSDKVNDKPVDAPD